MGMMFAVTGAAALGLGAYLYMSKSEDVKEGSATPVRLISNLLASHHADNPIGCSRMIYGG